MTGSSKEMASVIKLRRLYRLSLQGQTSGEASVRPDRGADLQPRVSACWGCLGPQSRANWGSRGRSLTRVEHYFDLISEIADVSS